MRVIGLDYGRARVGLALGDTETKIATPLSVIANEGIDELIDHLRLLAAQEKVSLFVIGVPHPLQDQARETDQAREIISFAAALKEAGFEVAEEDETWTTKLAATQAAEMNQRKKRDDLAAMAILQSYLDRLPAPSSS